MGVEHISVEAGGNASPTTGTRVPLGLSQSQGAVLKAVHFTFRALGVGPAVLQAALSEDLKTLTAGVGTPYMVRRGLLAVGQIIQDQATAVGITNALLTLVIPLWDVEVYQDLSWLPGISTATQRMDLYFEKFTISRLEKATQLRQQKRQFEFRR